MKAVYLTVNYEGLRWMCQHENFVGMALVLTLGKKLKSMSKKSYEEQAEVLSKAIDIAIESVKKFRPKDLRDSDIAQFISVYESSKADILDPNFKFKTLRALEDTKNGILIYFQEGSGPDVNFFWDRIREEKIEYKRVNKMAKILKRKRIANRMELDFVIDCIVPYQQEGLINEGESKMLKKMIGDFEKKGK
ncbi:hypothetical protein D4L85_24085 [Chryseolinea soli]|uniref:Uncharacterized protein n=2 Tax=Chryseolinea soli TaxID=2321403 RepID=A0A385SS71_9BACT|nr:hypothetical protein D4L85_24085 [Chryseolinea soli]